MTSTRFIVGDVFEVLRSLPDASVDLVCTSPPFLNLRSYLPADHPDKAREIGSEATPAEFIDTLLDVVEECSRVLAPHGSLVFELGSTMAGSGGAGGDYNAGGLREGQPAFEGSGRRSNRRDEISVAPPGAHGAGGGMGWPLDKSDCVIPQLFAVALSYGFNPLSGRSTDRWRVRNFMPWAKRNPPVGADGDKFRRATSYLTIACKARDRYWDGDSVRTPHTEPIRTNVARPKRLNEGGTRGSGGDDRWYVLTTGNQAGAPMLDWWYLEELQDRFEPDFLQLNTEAYKGAHYATFPRALVHPLVLTMCPQKVCTVCGKPSRRVVGEPEYRSLRGATSLGMREGVIRAGGVKQWTAPDGSNGSGWAREAPTLGWTDCGHDSWRPGVVLDPFAGSGTTGAVASGHGRNCLLVDLDERNAALAIERIGGLFCEVSHLGDPLPTWLQGTPPAGV